MSLQGTVIRVFSIVDKTKIYEFRRGVKRLEIIVLMNLSNICCFEYLNKLNVKKTEQTYNVVNMRSYIDFY